MGVHVQIMAMLMVLGPALVAHVRFQPYENKWVDHAETGSLVCSLLTLWFGSFFPTQDGAEENVELGHAGQVAISAVILVCNLGYMAFLGVVLYATSGSTLLQVSQFLPTRCCGCLGLGKDNGESTAHVELREVEETPSHAEHYPPQESSTIGTLQAAMAALERDRKAQDPQDSDESDESYWPSEVGGGRSRSGTALRELDAMSMPIELTQDEGGGSDAVWEDGEALVVPAGTLQDPALLVHGELEEAREGIIHPNP